MHLDQPELAELWRLARETLEGGGRSAFSIRVEDEKTAAALTELLRKPVAHPARRQISLARLDEHVRSHGSTLAEVLEALHGRPIGMSTAEEASTADAVLKFALRQHNLLHEPWAAPWIAHVRRYGKIPQPALPMLANQAAWVLGRLGPTTTRFALAGNDLDEGRPLARIVGKALELMGTTWEQAGILKDAYSDPVLTSQGYLTLNDILETPEITVVRSPRLLESGVPGPLMVLPNGLTAQAKHHLIGKVVRCHNDFTPDGIRATNDILAWTDGTAWRMSATDYREAVTTLIARGVELPTLNNGPAEATWDPDLAKTMTTTGLMVTEEHVLPSLL
ncbi:TIGR02679 domain-containing protein [Saccharothrix luteola]|uniref:TIGR02679 domain-containing protein n=1 Tax=Saccharothrix luteola TaxID=2893018 RepID=UPI001E3E6C27|nr:TIGR02679 domain-containing protein [Saccharothrix luteola]MCC8249769.1 TIGR02679 domain-containing protein [Saccharothrix luteola]